MLLPFGSSHFDTAPSPLDDSSEQGLPFALLIEVSSERIVRGVLARRQLMKGFSVEINLQGPATETGDALVGRFRELLMTGGLNPAEADGMIDAWHEGFFKTPGTRLLILMTRWEYDRFCPIAVNPSPTEMVRVGILWTEFPPSPQ